MGRYLIGALAALLVAYVAYPYLTIWQLDQAVNARNTAELDRLVDWDSVAAGLEGDMESLFERPEPAGDDPMDEAARNLIGIFVDLMIEPTVDFYASPRGLAYLLNNQVILDDPGEALEADFPAEDTWFDHIAFAFFTGPGEFQATVRHPRGRGSPGRGAKGNGGQGPMVLEFRLQGFTWQLTRVRIPLDDLAE